MKQPQNIDQSGHAVLEHLFTNGGEMGARIKAFNWLATPLGSTETWSPSLQIALQILLSSKFPMQILWGTNYIQFYNDAYIPIAGDKHPAGLGQRGEDCWREVWDFSGPLLDGVMATGIATWSEDQLMVLDRHGFSEECYFTFSYTPIWEMSGTVGGIFIAVQETTQKILSARRERDLRIETQAAQAAAEQANRMKDQFLAMLSHELRSPLNPILGWANLLRTHELDQTRTSQALETIERNAKLQARMIDDLLDVSRILNNKFQLNLTSIDLISIIQDALETVKAQVQAKAINIQTQLGTTSLQMVGDGNRLQQVVWNLLSNAVKFTPQGGQIAIHLDYSDEWADLQVIDSGRGITADFLPHVFDHFRQAETITTKTSGGLGLGLAIAKQIVDRHGGTIQAESLGAGQGATFRVSLPLITDHVQPPQTDDGGAIDSHTCLTSIHVLVVEDDDDSREMLGQTLEMYGARVTAVASAAAAMAVISNNTPDIMISDLGMPEVDGFMLMQQVRRAIPDDQMPAIALSAYARESDQKQALAAGFQAHLLKPLEPDKLVKTVAEVVAQSSQRP